MTPARIMLTGNTAFKLANFRASLIARLAEGGHDLIALVPEDEHATALRSLGCRVIPLKMSRKGTNPIRELALVSRFFRVIQQEKPAVILGFTIKNNIYGALAARALSVPFLPNVTGLGTAFSDSGLLNRTVVGLYRMAFARVPAVFFQNETDQTVLERAGIVTREQSRLLPGSGVDLDRFEFCEMPKAETKGLRFTLISRMLRDKGIVEFVQAACRLRDSGVQARFELLGPVDTGNSGTLTLQDIRGLERECDVKYSGETRDVRPVIERSDCIVLPSYYREGTPRVLLEAAAMGRPIITTDMPGCRDTVVHGETGFLVQPRNVDSLTEAMATFADLSTEDRSAMGRAARSRAETAFDESIVIDAYLKEIAAVTASKTA